jgi:hypothetical protein
MIFASAASAEEFFPTSMKPLQKFSHFLRTTPQFFSELLFFRIKSTKNIAHFARNPSQIENYQNARTPPRHHKALRISNTLTTVPT